MLLAVNYFRKKASIVDVQNKIHLWVELCRLILPKTLFVLADKLQKLQKLQKFTLLG